MKHLKGDFLLLITAFIWGTSFIFQKLGMNYIEPFTFGGTRFLLGAMVLVPVIKIFDVMAAKKAAKLPKSEQPKTYHQKDLIVGGILCGVALFLGASFQQWGIVETTAGKAGFITALYIVIVPLLGLFMNKKVSLFTWSGVLLAVFGLYLLCIKEDFSMQRGDAIVLAGTLFWALQIVIVDLYNDKTDGLKLSFVQFVTAGLLSIVCAFLFETPTIKAIMDCSAILIYTAVMVVGVAYTLQIIGQKSTTPTVAAIILSLESVFAVISGALVLGETMSSREMLGCAIMFVAVVATQVNPKEIWTNLKKAS